jgi:hypothetical protein
VDVTLLAEDIANEVSLGDLAILPVLESTEAVGTNFWETETEK